MHEIDFLPLEYHQQSAQRRQQPWRAVVLLGFLALLSVAALVDYQRRHRLLTDLQAIEPLHEKAVAQTTRLADLQSQARSARSESELYAYLRHPWPRSQILSALLAPLPGEIALEQVKIHKEVPSGRVSATASGKTDSKAEEAEQARLPAAARDLRRLRAESDPAQTMVLLTGLTKESAALHTYLTEVGKKDLFGKVQLRSIETVKSPRGPALRFVAAILVRPGYGQPGGPTPAEKTTLAQTDGRAAQTRATVP